MPDGLLPEIDEALVLPRTLAGLGTGSLFPLKVQKAYPDLGLLDTDWVVIHQQPTASEGDLVALLLDGDCIYQRFAAAEHDDYAIIMGVVALVLRRPSALQSG